MSEEKTDGQEAPPPPDPQEYVPAFGDYQSEDTYNEWEEKDLPDDELEDEEEDWWKDGEDWWEGREGDGY